MKIGALFLLKKVFKKKEKTFKQTFKYILRFSKMYLMFKQLFKKFPGSNFVTFNSNTLTRSLSLVIKTPQIIIHCKKKF